MGEDACRVRKGGAPQVLAALCNTVIHLLAGTGAESRVAATDRLAARPKEALGLLQKPRCPLSNGPALPPDRTKSGLDAPRSHRYIPPHAHRRTPRIPGRPRRVPRPAGPAALPRQARGGGRPRHPHRARGRAVQGLPRRADANRRGAGRRLPGDGRHADGDQEQAAAAARRRVGRGRGGPASRARAAAHPVQALQGRGRPAGFPGGAPRPAPGAAAGPGGAVERAAAVAAGGAVGPRQRLRPADARDDGAADARRRRGPDAAARLHGNNSGPLAGGIPAAVRGAVHAAVHARPTGRPVPRRAGADEAEAYYPRTGRAVHGDLGGSGAGSPAAHGLHASGAGAVTVSGS